MSAAPTLRSRLRDNRVVLAAISVALLLITGAYYALLRGRELDPALVNNQILLFFLRNVDAVLILTILYVLIRDLVKIWVERQGRRLGAKFKTKLVATYIGLSLIPVLVLFLLATELVQGSLDNLFDTEVSELYEPGFVVAQELTNELEARGLRDAQRALDVIRDYDPTSDRDVRLLAQSLEAERNRLGLDVVVAYQDTDFVHGLLDPQSGLRELPEIGRGFLLNALRAGQTTRVEQLSDDRLLILAAQVDEQPGRVGSRMIVVTGSVIGSPVAASLQKLIERHQSRRQLEVLESDIRAVYLLSFLTMTLLILLISTWVGLYLARRITVPIQALAEGTRRIMDGDLDHRVQEAADDELGVLVDSFNRMTAELQSNKRLLERSNDELLHTNQRLDEERAWIGTVLESVAAGVLSVDEEGTVLTCNGAALDMLRLRGQHLVGQRLLDAVASSQALTEMFEDVLAQSGDQTIRREYRITLDREWKTFEVAARALRGDDEETTGRVIVLEDLTELIRAQQLATWNEAARRIAHEIKNPLTPIKLSAERLLHKHREKDPDFDETLEKSVAIIVREVGKMKSLVDEFSRFARMPQPTPKPVDLGRLLEDTVALYRDIKPGLAVSARLINPEAQRASLDAELMRSALTNLIDNAVEATGAPGEVEVTAERRNGSMLIRVADTGPGVPLDARAKLFLPYFSTKGRGTGLGLSIVHRIVTDHHGTIRVDSNEPHGAVFTIELPQDP